MTRELFWRIINECCGADPYSANEWDGRLTDALAELSPDEIIEWDKIFDQLAADAYRTDLWAAAYLINGGASDDGFYYFRCWLIGMGKDVYESAIADPDSLASVASPEWLREGIDAEAEIYAAAHRAWMRATGKGYDDEYPARNETATMVGDDWDFDDEVLMRKKLPRLWKLYED
jgi:hypothetical protein